MHKGSIVLVPFPFTDLSGQKVRLALVLFSSPRGEDFIAAFISSIPLKEKSSRVVPIQPTQQNGLKAASHIKVHKLATLQKKIVIGELGTLELTTQNIVDETLRDILAL